MAISTRIKETDLDNVLPSVSELMTEHFRRLHYTDLDSQPVVLEVDSVMDSDPYPIPMPVDRESYGNVKTSARYWATGRSDWLNVQDAIGRFQAGTGDVLRYLDFGCASGRVLRHALTSPTIESDLWGCDFAPSNINWMKQHLPSSIKGFINNDNPHLPFPDHSFDLVTAFSVFTHIDNFEDAWLLELSRITHPDGLLYLTVQNEASWTLVSGRQELMDRLVAARKISGNAFPIDAKMFDGPMPLDRIVIRTTEDENYNCNVWHSTDYIHSSWGRYFDVLHIADNAHTNFQSPVILRPKKFRIGSGNSSYASMPISESRPKPR